MTTTRTLARILTVVAIALIAALAAPFAASAQASATLPEAQQPRIWIVDQTQTIFDDTTANVSWHQQIQRAVTAWDKSSQVRVALTARCLERMMYCTTIRFGTDGQDDEWAAYATGLEEDATGFLQRSRRPTIVINSVDIVTAPQPWQYKRMVVCHELGHILGLQHQERAGCMKAVVMIYNIPSYMPGAENLAQAR